MKYFTFYLIVSSQQNCAMMVCTYKLFSRHSWYIAIAHIHFFGRPAKLGILILLAELRLHDLYVDGVMGGGLNIQLG